MKGLGLRPTTPCWEWPGAIHPRSGYGSIEIAGVAMAAHRYMHEKLIGPIPEALTIDHLCGNRACVNPTHLEPVTQLVNNRRALTCASTINARKTHCHRGHPFDEENTYWRMNGKYAIRSCRTCNRESARRYSARKRKEHKS